MADEIYRDRLLETSTTTGTGTLTLAGAVTGHQSFAAIGDGNPCFAMVMAVDGSGVPTGDWEVFRGVYTSAGTTLTRATVLASSNGGSAVDFGAGTKHVACVAPAAKVSLPDVQIYTDPGGNPHTWTKPIGCSFVDVTCIGGGGGGGSGRKGSNINIRTGGGGGGGGAAGLDRRLRLSLVDHDHDRPARDQHRTQISRRLHARPRLADERVPRHAVRQ